jgi:hypothetical protein
MGKLTALSPLIGRWSTTITMLYPAEQKAVRFQADDTYRWLPGENIVIHEVTGEMDGKPVRSIEIYSSDGSGRIHARSYDSGGEVSDFRASMRNGEWRIEGDSQRFASTTLTRGVIEGLWQLKTGNRWLDWMTVSLQRQD